MSFGSDVDCGSFIRMLHAEPEQHLSLAQVKQHDWGRKSHPCKAPPVTIIPRGDDPTLFTTVLPFLVALHLSSTDQDQELEQSDFITAFDVHVSW